jgi:hypothetical protein
MVTNISNGQWYVEWPDLTQTPEAPTVANLIELGIAHWSSIGGAVLPSLRVPVHASVDRSQGKRGARKRERRLRQLWSMSNVSELAALWWGDYAGGGSAILGAWCDFTKPDRERNPYLIRFDPRHAYMLKDNLGNITELLIARVLSQQELRAMLPEEHKTIFSKSGDQDVQEWFWYDKDTLFHALVDVSKDGRSSDRQLVLVEEENKLGFVPAWEVTRPTFDGQRRGVFDQTVHILRTMHRLMTLTIASTEEHSFPAILEYNVRNPGDFGPGAILSANSEDAKMERLSPSQHFDVKDLIKNLADQADRQSVLPQQLSGEPGASIVSSRGINALMGSIDARLALAHKQFEIGFGKVSGFLLAIDEIFCDGEKTIKGDERDNDQVETFLPSRDINGAWDANCTYGIGAGSDPSNIEVRLAMHIANGLVSKETARSNLPFLEDPDAEPVKIMREGFQQALLAGVVAMAQQGQPEAAAYGLELLDTDDVDFDDIVMKMVKYMTQPAPAQGDPGAAALQAGESLARGGIPGNAAQGPPAANLPPLGQILQQGPGYVQ